MSSRVLSCLKPLNLYELYRSFNIMHSSYITLEVYLLNNNVQFGNGNGYTTSNRLDCVAWILTEMIVIIIANCI